MKSGGTGKWLALALMAFTIGTVALFVKHPWWMPVDISSEGEGIDGQIRETLIATAILFVLGQLFLSAMIWKFAGERRGKRVRHLPAGAAALVTVAVLCVGVEIASMTFIGSKVWASIYLTRASSQALRVDVQAQQFAYHFRYPGPDGMFGTTNVANIDDSSGNYFGLDTQRDPAARDDIVSSTLVVPAGREIALTLHARDVGHSFYVPELRIQQDFVPGLTIPLHFTAKKPGMYEIVCTQLCGLGHASMRAYLRVLPPEDFEKWLKAQTPA